MKKYIFTFFVLLQTISLVAQTSRFKESETLNVWAISGLNMRDKSDAKATKIAAIPYGSKVIVQPNIGIKVPFEVEEFKGFIVKGYWLLVKYGDTEGFVFDGFLSRLPAPIPTEQDLAIVTYLHQQIKEVGKKYDIQIGEGSGHRLLLPTEKYDEKFISGFKQKYAYNILYEVYESQGAASYKIVSSDLTIYEGYILIKTFFYDSKTDIFTFDKKEKSINLMQKEPSMGCHFKVQKIGNKLTIEGFCTGC
jgi:hypothetical protein